jgi:Zn finger protein HypA/HybF involved in hydrogenase expression
MTERTAYDDNQHLKRSMYCDDCPWVGISGELIARDKLRCPKCDSANVKYLVADSPERLQ